MIGASAFGGQNLPGAVPRALRRGPGARLSKSQRRLSTLQFNARRPAHPVCQHFHAQQEIPMNNITKILVSGTIALLLCVGEAALFAASTSASEPASPLATQHAGRNLDRPTRNAYHRQLLGGAARHDASIAQR
jgi:hypothetical protein